MEFFDVLVRYEVALWSVVDRELSRQHEISLAQLHALRVLARRSGQGRVQDLSDDVGITVGAASKLVDRLERDGLAERSPNPTNRRSSLITLTAAGEQALSTALHVFTKTVSDAVGDHDVETVIPLLRSLLLRIDPVAAKVAA